MTVTSEGSAIEVRIHFLQKQLKDKQAEIKRVTNERNRQRKARLRKQEEDLKAELQVGSEFLSVCYEIVIITKLFLFFSGDGAESQ